MANIQPMTLGQHLDSVLSAAGHDVTIAKTGVETWGTKAWNFVKSEWHNIITAVSTGFLALRALGKL
jgi:hypothetical protein